MTDDSGLVASGDTSVAPFQFSRHGLKDAAVRVDRADAQVRRVRIV